MSGNLSVPSTLGKVRMQLFCTLYTEEEEKMSLIYVIPKRASGELEGTRRLLPPLPPFKRGTHGNDADKPVHAECAEHVRAKIELQLCCILFTKEEKKKRWLQCCHRPELCCCLIFELV